MKLLLSWHRFCVHKKTMHQLILQCYFIRSRICRMHVCLSVTCHLHIWQNDRDLLCAAAVTWGGKDTKISQHKKLTLKKTILPLLVLELEPKTLQSRVHCSTTELTSKSSLKLRVTVTTKVRTVIILRTCTPSWTRPRHL